MSQAVTKKDLESAFERLNSNFKERFDSLESQMKHGFKTVENRLEILEDDMSKVKDVVLNTDVSMHNLVEELEHNGLAVNRSRVFSV